MEGDPNFSLVRRTPGGVEQIRPGVKRVVEGMVGDALELARKNSVALAGRRIRIGDLELCEPDYRQILRWAKALDFSPEQVISRLQSEDPEVPWSQMSWASDLKSSQFFNGKLCILKWSFKLLPLKDFEWEVGLSITHAILLSGGLPLKIEVLPRTLTHLHCSAFCLSEIDLSGAPLLSELSCWLNRLTELDLSKVPQLERVWCGGNHLTGLDLNSVPLLKELDCNSNKLTELDLTPVPLLTGLNGYSNLLTELDLTPVPLLTGLSCACNRLTELNLTPVPLLTVLICRSNELTELDLTPVPQLTTLYCESNELTELNLFSVPLLASLGCDGNPIGILDIRHLFHLKVLSYDKSTTVLLQRPDQHF